MHRLLRRTLLVEYLNVNHKWPQERTTSIHSKATIFQPLKELVVDNNVRPFVLASTYTLLSWFLLCYTKGQCEVCSPAFWVQFWVIKRLGIEAVYESCERHAVVPAAGEVCDVDVLKCATLRMTKKYYPNVFHETINQAVDLLESDS